MLAWMNEEALLSTLQHRKATFFSRSRQSLWVKGEGSGHLLHVAEVFLDCDGDTVLVLCDPEGPSCHTGADNCFFVRVAEESEAQGSAAKPLLAELEKVLDQRKASSAEKSYTKSLFDAGPTKIGAKVTEEAGEFVQALTGESDDRVQNEAADLIYHLMVGLRHRGLSVRSVLSVLGQRMGIGGHVEKAARSAKP